MQKHPQHAAASVRRCRQYPAFQNYLPKFDRNVETGINPGNISILFIHGVPSFNQLARQNIPENYHFPDVIERRRSFGLRYPRVTISILNHCTGPLSLPPHTLYYLGAPKCHFHEPQWSLLIPSRVRSGPPAVSPRTWMNSMTRPNPSRLNSLPTRLNNSSSSHVVASPNPSR